ncbi:MAG: hypothetical protein AAF214_07730 [Pseudomonadota bacterium]
MTLAPPTLVTTVTYDVDGTKGWSSIQEAHNAGGFLVSRITTMDSGSVNTELFEALQRVSQTVTDTDANSANWSSRTVEWNWEGAKTARTTLFDDGSRLVEGYDVDSGVRTSRTEYDDGGAEKWASYTTLYDDTGKIKTGIEKVLDNGRIDSFTYDAASGETIQRKITDGGDKKAWDTKTMTYDVDSGKLTSRTIIDDDNSSLAITWNDGVRATRTEIDGDADTFEWYSRETIYDVNGKRAQLNETRDDGDFVVSNYAGDKLLDVTTYDNSGDEAWHIERVFYDPKGNVTDTQYYDESGNTFLF